MEAATVGHLSTLGLNLNMVKHIVKVATCTLQSQGPPRRCSFVPGDTSRLLFQMLCPRHYTSTAARVHGNPVTKFYILSTYLRATYKNSLTSGYLVLIHISNSTYKSLLREINNAIPGRASEFQKGSTLASRNILTSLAKRKLSLNITSLIDS